LSGGQKNRTDLQQLSELRLREAQALLAVGLADGAYYLAGYAIECALKACIAKRTREHDFPDKKLVGDSYTHDLKRLFRLAELEGDFDVEMSLNPAQETNWTIVLSWSEDSRYERRRSVLETIDLLNAIEDETRGLLPWLRQRW
jgi:HEPN domain-containing protein